MGRYSLGGGAGGDTNATTVTITDNESTDEDNAIIFTAGGDLDGGDLGLESDGTLNYNPSTGLVTATAFTGGTIDASTDFTIGTTVITDDVITFTPTSSDTVTMTSTTHGAFSLVTVDDAAAAANIQITADGTVDIDSAGVLTLDSGAAINIEPVAGSAILLDGTISVDAGVVTGATSITSTAFVGDVTGTADVATVATSITAVANNTANETVYPAFVDGATGTQGIETDTGLTYNPSTGTITATVGAFGDVMFANGWYFTELEKLDMGTGMALCKPDGEIAHVFR